MFRSKAKPKPKKKTSILTRVRREVSKDLLIFTAGAVSATVFMANRRKQKRLKDQYRQKVKKLKR